MKGPYISDGTLEDMRHQILKLAAANSCRPCDIEMYHGPNCKISNGFLIWAKFNGVKVRENPMVSESEAVLIRRHTGPSQALEILTEIPPWPGAGFFIKEKK